jgi:hypothetical protein
VTGPNRRDRLPRFAERALPVLFLAVVAASGYRFYLARHLLDFTDENDHTAVGWLLTQGETLYGSLFSHHMPLPYLLAQLLAFAFPDAPASAFRLIPLLAYLLVGVLLVVSPVGRMNRRAGWLAGAAFLVLVSITLPPFLGHLLLMDNLEGCGLAVFLAFITLPALLRIPCRKRDDLVGGLGAGFALAASPMALFPLAAGALPLLTSGLRSREEARALLLRLARIAAGVAAFAIPVALWLVSFGSPRGFVADVFDFNREAYAPFLGAPDGSTLKLLAIGLAEWARLANVPSARDILFLWRSLMAFLFLAAGALAATAFLASRGAEEPGSKVVRGAVATGELVVLLALSRLRGFEFRALPFLILVLTLGSISGGLLLAVRRRLRDAALSGLFVAPIVVFSLLHRTTRVNASAPAPWPPQVAPIAEYIRSHTDPRERIAVFSVSPRLYLEARRHPATDSVFYLPWQARWDEVRTDRPTTCDQLRASRPRFVYYQTQTIWGTFEWSRYGACIDRFVRENYRPLPEPAFQNSLWERRPPAASPAIPRD